MEPIKPILGNVFAVVISLALGIILVEIGLRFLPTSVTGITKELALMADPDIAFLRKPNQVSRSESACFSVAASTNSHGFRDEEWEGDQPIVVLGDSYMEALQVGDNQHFSAMLESLLGIPVANLGRSSFGTVGELAVFEKFGSPLNPQLVILAFFAENDVDDNNCRGSRAANGTVTKSCGEVIDGIVSFPTNFYSTAGNHILRSFIREQCRTCLLIKNAIDREAFRRARPEEVSREQVALYAPTHTGGEDIEVSWQITEVALSQLKASVEAAGAGLVIVSVPSYLSYSNDSRRSLSDRFGGAQLPQDIDPHEPERRLEAAALHLGIPFLGLEDSFRNYRTTQNLPSPLFSYWCDGHWNPLGHTLAAVEVVQWLGGEMSQYRALVSSESLTSAQNLLKKSPYEILGVDGINAIYKQGMYYVK